MDRFLFYLLLEVANGVIICVCQKVFHIGGGFDIVFEMIHKKRTKTLSFIELEIGSAWLRYSLHIP